MFVFVAEAASFGNGFAENGFANAGSVGHADYNDVPAEIFRAAAINKGCCASYFKAATREPALPPQY